MMFVRVFKRGVYKVDTAIVKHPNTAMLPIKPIKINSQAVQKLHGGKGILQTRHKDGKQFAYCLKFSTFIGETTKWKNKIVGNKLIIAMNPRSTWSNALVKKGDPVHIVTHKRGTTTLYRGRFRCIYPDNTTHFVMEFVDKGIADELKKATKFKSDYEVFANEYFETRGWSAQYEKTMFEYEIETGDTLELSYYTPDFWIPEHNCYVEIKGFKNKSGEAEPTQETMTKCKTISDAGHHIVLVQGDARNSPIFTYWEPFGEPESKEPWWWSSRKRKRYK